MAIVQVLEVTQAFPVFLSVLNSISVLCFGRFFGKKGCLFLIFFFISFGVLQTFIESFYINPKNVTAIFNILDWIKIFYFFAEWNFAFDVFNKTMCFAVQVVAICVSIYSFFYMSTDPHVIRFYGFVGLFIFFMKTLITSNNFLVFFFGWEGVGICSYLLVNFWFFRANANKSALKALFVNRIGDLSLILSIVILFFFTNAFDFDTSFPIIQFFCRSKIYIFGTIVFITNLISFFLFFGAAGKSAQIGLHTWLPDAMEGPTPVSALIHAATMVTAGILLIIKSSWIFEHSGFVLATMSFIGSLTSIFAASVGLFQKDIKKIVAYSTCSQLGYMFSVCGLSGYVSSFFHLLNHSFFKALLFLSAGSVIHSMQDEQDLRKLGGIFYLIIYTSLCFFIGSAALSGIPFLSGFYSKDFILETSFSKYTFSGTAAYYSGILTSLITLSYSYKVFHMAFANFFSANKNFAEKIKESNFFLNLVLTILVIGSIFFGFLVRDRFSGVGSDLFFPTIFTKVNNNYYLSAEMLNSFIKNLPFYVNFPVLLLLQFFLWKNLTLSLNYKEIIIFLIRKWKFDFIFNKNVNLKVLLQAYQTNFINFDKGLLEWMGPRLILFFFVERNLIIKLKSIHSGIFFNYGYAYIYMCVIFFFTVFSQTFIGIF